MALSMTFRNKQVRQLGFFDEVEEKKKPQKGASFNDPAFGNNKTLPIPSKSQLSRSNHHLTTLPQQLSL